MPPLPLLLLRDHKVSNDVCRGIGKVARLGVLSLHHRTSEVAESLVEYTEDCSPGPGAEGEC
jgi:hypothetical protein